MPGQSLSKNSVISGARYTFQRNDGAFFDIPRQFSIRKPGTSRRYKVSDRLRQDGGEGVGDGTYRPVQLTMAYGHFATDDTTYRDTINEMEGFFRNDQRPFYLIDNNNSIRTEVLPSRNTIQSPAGNNERMSNNSWVFDQVDGLWESIDQFIQPGGTGGTLTGTGLGTTGDVSGFFMQDEDTVAIVNEGKFDAFPILTFVALDNVIKFVFTNETLGGGFEFESNDFISNATLVVNAVTGDITLNGVERSSALTRGGFITLLPGENELKYESDNGDIALQVVWRTRFIY